jgi:DNA-binding response OmpR family regulator
MAGAYTPGAAAAMEPQPRAERETQTILIVDSDESIRRILDLTLRHAGFSVGLASNREEAMKRLADRPDLVIAAASDPDALALCRLIKQTGDRMPPAVVLISDPGIENKTRGLEAGADDFVIKPLYVQEVVARTRALLQRRERERLELFAHAHATAPAEGAETALPAGDRFVSDISDLPLVDLLWALSAHQRSGVAMITAAAGARGEIFFRQGNVVDAEVGRLSGRDAIYRLFCWSSGRLEIEWKSIRRKDTIEMRPHDLLMEALRRVDDWRRLLTGLPSLDTVFEVNYRILAERLADIPDEVNRILRLFDRMRTFLQVIDDCGLSDLEAAAAVGKLWHEQIIRDIRLPAAEEELLGADIEGWLTEPTGPFRAPAAVEPDRAGASPEAGSAVHPASHPGPLGEVAVDPRDDERRARFTDRLEAEGHVQEPPTEVPAAPATPSSASPTTLQGFFSTAAPEAMRALVAPPAAPGEMAISIEAATSLGDAAPSGDAASLGDAAPSGDTAPSGDAEVTAVGDPTPLREAAPLVGVDSPIAPPLAPVLPQVGSLPAGFEARSASGEIVVPPSSAKVKQSPAAEARLAYLREETARAFVRPSQFLTPPGSARALDEPPPLVDAPVPVPIRRTTPLIVTSVGERPSGTEPDDDLDEIETTSHRRGALLVAAVAVLVLGAGALVLKSHRKSALQSFADEPSAEGNAPPSPTSTPLPGGPPVPAGASSASAPAPLPVAAPVALGGVSPAEPGAAQATAIPPAPGALDEREADPKMARTRAAEAAPLLSACHQSFEEQRMKDAEAACTAARDANMDSAEAHGLLAHALFNRNRRRESLAEAERAVKLNPRWADAYVIIGGVHQDAGEMDDAKRAYQRYLELDPRGQYAGDLRAIVDRLGKL